MWMLLLIVFSFQPDGSLKQEMVAHRIYATENACNIAGRNLANELPVYPRNVKSISICIPRAAFDKDA